jgi:topoisomerase-4 subunit A
MTDTPNTPDSPAPAKEANPAIIDTPFGDALSERYLTYALSTIMARSLPDVRDGLKPVHRRLLWAMRLLKLDPATGYKKCARVVGDVMGKFHPHGDQAIYDALVRLAQTFSVRYPLIDGQGNFGNIDGDNAAAMRYTEARLTAVATALMDGLDEECVPYRTTYDGEEVEPEVLPGGFPNLLANGAAGIAVGMATSIPPHNLGEIVDALSLRLDAPDCTLDAILACLPAPDFPTGGVLVETPQSIRESYASGRGAFRLRAQWSVEDLGRGTWVIVVTQIPYQVAKSKLIEAIAQLIFDKKLPILEDVRDESADEIRLVLEPKSRNVDPHMLMESLFKLTDLEIRFSLNMNVLDKNRTPRIMPLLDVLDAYLEHQRDILLRRTQYRLGKIDDRLELLAGYLITYLNLDEVIRIIREDDAPKEALMASFAITERQAEAILNMRLRSLRKLEEMALRTEEAQLQAERLSLTGLLESPAQQTQALKAALAKLKALHGPSTPHGVRRTQIQAAPDVVAPPPEAFIEREPITVICSEKGWIRALKGHIPLGEEQKFKEGDGPRFTLHAYTTDKLLIAADTGKFFTLNANTLPGGRGFGDPVRVMIDLDSSSEICAMLPLRQQGRLLLAASDGRGFIIPMEACVAATKSGKQIMLPKAPAKLRFVLPVVDADHVGVVGDNRRLLIFPLQQVPEMVRGQGVWLQKYKDGGMGDICLLRLHDGLSWPMGGEQGRIRQEKDLTPWLGTRGQVGRLPPLGFPRSGRFAG